ncbi:hypothetical protein SUGI_0599450 [Cryptomeria japonica]|nr:hypothetical protein SUGI_0599450 [Cryptomeria japonica]
MNEHSSRVAGGAPLFFVLQTRGFRLIVRRSLGLAEEPHRFLSFKQEILPLQVLFEQASCETTREKRWQRTDLDWDFIPLQQIIRQNVTPSAAHLLKLLLLAMAPYRSDYSASGNGSAK